MGYDALYATGRIREIGCWAHARRGFVEALTTDVRAALMVALLQQLYQVERAGAELSTDARRALRAEQSGPLLAKIAAERDALAQTALPKSPLGDALLLSDQSVDGAPAIRRGRPLGQPRRLTEDVLRL